jgi:arylsulfatase A-like enzyme
MRPNVLICVVDALRTDRVGGERGQTLTPNIGKFAEDSTVFSEAYSTTNATDPAITSLLTGRYPLGHGVVNHGWKVTTKEKQRIESVPYLPELLQQSGYRTGKFGRPLGRWHRHGFDRYPEVGEWRESKETDPVTDVEMRLSSWLDGIDPRLRRATSSVYQHTVGQLREWSEQSDATDTIGRADVTGELRSFLGSDDPFFALVHLMDTHVPYKVDREYTRLCLSEFDYENVPLADVVDNFPEGSFSHDRLRPGGNIYEAAEPWADSDYGIGTAVVSAQYDASVMKADERVGTILSMLKDNGYLEETLVVLLADHGESLTEHGIYYDHHGLYEQSVRIPFVIRPPDGAKTGVCDGFAQITDVVPTVAAYVDIEKPQAVDGHSLRPAIESGDPPDRTAVVAEEAHTQRRRMIRTPNKKLIYHLEGDRTCRYCELVHEPDRELYDLKRDPAETENCASRRPERSNELQEEAERRVAELTADEPAMTTDGTGDYDDEEEIMDRLKALGYR